MKVFKIDEDFDATGTSLSGYIQANYKQLVEVLGEPTFNEASGDDKVQVEWVCEFDEDIFTIYDWKTYDREYTINELNKFNIGSKVIADDFIEMLEAKIKETLN
jgi:hypothetical protein